MSPATLLDASGVTVRFGHFTANDAIDLRVSGGEVVGLLGANGAGKSTFMRVVLGLRRPSAGTVRLFGSAPSRQARRRIGYVPQGLGLYEDLTVVENLRFTAGGYGTPPPPLAAEPALAAEAHTLVRDLPLGLRRRVAFAAALSHHPSLLVLDEPTSGVDPLGRSALWDTIRAAADGGAGVLVSTHYMEEAEHCDRVVILAAGRVIAGGTVTDLVAGREALEVTTDRWDAAFLALDAAGWLPSLRGRALRLLGADAARVGGVLREAGVDARLATVPATFDEAFVELVAAAAHR
jgi:ABC-2 type transport system ATP-binding protein/ribosome-dependent ATPase